MIKDIAAQAREFLCFHFEGPPCVHCGSTRRASVDGRCYPCQTARSMRSRHRNPAMHRARVKRALANQIEKARKKEAKRLAAVMRARSWRKKNPGHRNALKAAYKAARGHRTPRWADLGAIASFYKACPRGHHVDHVIPLRGAAVSGLHVESNLQYLPAIENMRKNRSFA